MEDKIKGYVYLLGDWGRENVYKIGVTKGTIENRIKKLQTGNSGEIYIINYYHTEHPFFVEKWLHKLFSSKKVMNEWFELSVDDISNFKEYCKKYDEIYENTKIKDENSYPEYL